MISKNSFIKHNFRYSVLVFLFIIFCIQRLFFMSSGLFEIVSSYLAYPIVLMQGKVSNLINSYNQKNQETEKLRIVIDSLQKEKEDLFSENVQLKSSLAYLEQVSELIEFKKKFNINVITTAQVMSKYISDISHFFLIDKGSQQGINKNMVAVYKNCLVGKVTEVYPGYSKLILITDKDCKVAAYCFKTGAMGIYEGSNQLDRAQLNYVNHLDNLIEDDLLISSGEGLVFPQGFILGKISKFTNDGIQYHALVKSVIDIDKIKYCQIIQK